MVDGEPVADGRQSAAGSQWARDAGTRDLIAALADTEDQLRSTPAADHASRLVTRQHVIMAELSRRNNR